MTFAVLDTETTGVRRDHDRIVELALLLDGSLLTWRMNPGMPIPAEATAVHGITDVDVADCATFADLWPDIFSHLSGATVIAGFRVAFDIDMIQAELTRAKLPLLDPIRVHLIDVAYLWSHVEPRTLTAAHEKFCGGSFAAHSAGEDVRATERVLQAIVERFGLPTSHADLAELCDPMADRKSWFGPTRHLTWDGECVRVGFGKHAGAALHEFDRGFLTWVTERDFPEHVKLACRAAMTLPADEFLRRAKARAA